MKINRRNHLLSAPVQIFFAPEGGGSSPQPPAEPATLAEAKTSLTTLRGELATAQTTLAAAQGQVAQLTTERNSLQAQFDTATQAAVTANQERDRARADLATANASITAITGERDQARADHTTSQGNVARLEQLCGIRGIDPKAAVPAVAGTAAGGKSTDQQIEALQATFATASPAEKYSIACQIRELRDKK